MGTLKSIVSGGVINGEIKGGSIFKFNNEATLVFGANINLNANDGSNAITDRLHIIHFEKVFEKVNGFDDSFYKDDDKFLSILLTNAAKYAHGLQKTN